MQDFVVSLTVVVVTSMVAFEVIKVFWALFCGIVFGFKPVLFDQKQMDRTVSHFAQARQQAPAEQPPFRGDERSRIASARLRHGAVHDPGHHALHRRLEAIWSGPQS